MKSIKNQLVGLDPKFNYRGLNQTRIETFSDAVFAFSLTLVVLSSSVPATFAELRESFRDIIPFFFCAILIVIIWYQHYVFFLRYGLQDMKTVVINTFLLFVLLIYVYPLKFLMDFIFEIYASLFTQDWSRPQAIMGTDGDGGHLLAWYGIGAALIFLSLAWLYRVAYRRKENLALDPYEQYITKISIWSNLLMSTVPILSSIIAMAGFNYIVAGFTYMLYPFVMIPFGYIMRRKISKKFP